MDNDGLGTEFIDNTDSTFYLTGLSSSDRPGHSVVFGNDHP